MKTRVVLASSAPMTPEVRVHPPSLLQTRTSGFGFWASELLTHQSPAALREQLAASYPEAAVGIITGPLATQPARILLLDVDSTLTTTEAVDLLAAHAGLGPKVAKITERAMRGELDFEASLRERVAALAGLPERVFDEVAPQMTLSTGALELIAGARQAGCLVGVTSGGFSQLVAPLAQRLGLDFWNANQLEVVDGQLTGKVIGPVVDREQKERDLRRFADANQVDLSQTVAVGDGANDLAMLSAAGLGIAYCAKPLTAGQATVAINFPRLDAVLPFAFER